MGEAGGCFGEGLGRGAAGEMATRGHGDAGTATRGPAALDGGLGASAASVHPSGEVVGGRQREAKQPARKAGGGWTERREMAQKAGRARAPGEREEGLHSGDEGRVTRGSAEARRLGQLRCRCSDFGFSGFRDSSVDALVAETGPLLRLHPWLVPWIGCAGLRVLFPQPVELRDPLPQRDCGRFTRPSPRRRRKGKNAAMTAPRREHVNPTNRGWLGCLAPVPTEKAPICHP